MPAIQALAEGYDVFIVTDASGGVSLEAHDMAVRRMVAAGAVPITWLAVLGEWQRDWAREKTAAGVAAVVLEHGGASGCRLGLGTAASRDACRSGRLTCPWRQRRSVSGTACR